VVVAVVAGGVPSKESRWDESCVVKQSTPTASFTRHCHTQPQPQPLPLNAPGRAAYYNVAIAVLKSDVKADFKFICVRGTSINDWTQTDKSGIGSRRETVKSSKGAGSSP
jgi:hypothetical protein